MLGNRATSDIMGSKLDNEPITEPTIETVLERLNQLGNSLTGRLDTIKAAVSGIHQEIRELRQDVHKVERRVEVLSIDVVKLRGDMRLIEDLVGPESK